MTRDRLAWYVFQIALLRPASWFAGRGLTGGAHPSQWMAPDRLDPPAVLGRVVVVLVGPKKPATVGSVARSCSCFEVRVDEVQVCALPAVSGVFQDLRRVPAGQEMREYWVALQCPESVWLGMWFSSWLVPSCIA
jgi:hypothetical protein